MNIARFLEHWSITENPFRAEEARHDPVFARLGVGPTTHPDFEKILGDLDRPSTAIVFGEKGSGKTAIRLQMARRIAEHNRERPESRVLLVAYDDLNPVIDRIVARATSKTDPKTQKVAQAIKTFRLVDHMDAVLHAGVSALVDDATGVERDGDPGAAPGRDARRSLRSSDRRVRSDFALLQALYDRDDPSGARARSLRRAIRAPISVTEAMWTVATALGWLVPVGVFGASLALGREGGALSETMWTILFGAASGLWGLVLLRHLVWRVLWVRALAGRLAQQMPAVGRGRRAIAKALGMIPGADRPRDALPVDGSDEPRYEMFERFRRVARAAGAPGIVVVLDRVDEPTLVNGDADRMRAIVWPLLNNKLLQQEGVGFKLLLPIELRYELFRESSGFFQEARLDKQNLVERLAWTGAMLYDLCNARLNACRAAGSEPLSLADLFDEDVTTQDVIDALDQMHQPRDAFKLLYRCVQEHCSNVTEDRAAWRVPRLILETVRKEQSDRVQDFNRGVRPA